MQQAIHVQRVVALLVNFLPAPPLHGATSPKSWPDPSELAAAVQGSLPAAVWLQRLLQLCSQVIGGLLTVGGLSTDERWRWRRRGPSILQRAMERASGVIATESAVEVRSSHSGISTTEPPTQCKGHRGTASSRLCSSCVDGV